MTDAEALEGEPVRHDNERHAVQGRGESGRLVPSVGVGIAAAVLVAAVLGGSLVVFRHAGDALAVPSGAAHHATPTSSGPTVTPKVVYSLPEGGQPPSSFGSDPKRRGVWFVTGNMATASIVFVGVNPSRSRVFSLHAHYSLGSAGGIAVASDGTVWAGIKMVLIHLNPTTGAVTTYRVPTPGDSSAAEAYNPAWIKGTHFINAVAVTGPDTVALAIQDADQVVVFRGGRFVGWSLPVNTVPEDVAYLNDGTLGVSLSDFNTHHYDRVVTYTRSGARSESPLVDVFKLASTGTRFVSVDKQMDIFNADARLTATVPFVPAINPTLVITGGLGILPNGDLMVRSGDGILVASLSTGATVTLQLPRAACPNSISFSVPPPPHPAGYLCEQTPYLVASDGAGDLWMTLGNETQIDVVEGVGTK